MLFKEKENSQRNKKRLEEILLRKEHGNLLEIGGGLGGFIKLARSHFNAECLEISDYAIKSLQEMQGVKIIQGDIETLDLPANSYDAIVAFNVLEHLKFPDNVIKRIQLCLTHKGLFFGSIPNNYGALGGMVTRVGNLVDKTHCSTYPLSTWESLFAATYDKVDFFGETPIGMNHSIFIYGRGWKQISTNAIFVCEKY